ALQVARPQLAQVGAAARIPVLDVFAGEPRKGFPVAEHGELIEESLGLGLSFASSDVAVHLRARLTVQDLEPSFVAGGARHGADAVLLVDGELAAVLAVALRTSGCEAFLAARRIPTRLQHEILGGSRVQSKNRIRSGELSAPCLVEKGHEIVEILC